MERAVQWIQKFSATVPAEVRHRFRIDLRALAVFRIALGSLLLADLLLRSRNLRAFYTDAGVLPRVALFGDYTQVYSIHAWFGSLQAQIGLFMIAGIAAIAIIIGYRPQTAAVVSWILLVSLHARNPMVLNGGDVLLRMLVFWAIFLPTGKRWTLTSSTTNRTESTVVSAASAALLSQMVLLYVANLIHKSEGSFWFAGDAVSYVFSLDQFTILLGNSLEGFQLLLTVFNYLWIGVLFLSPLLLISTGITRATIASAVGGMHLGMFLMLKLGLFPLIAVAGLIPFYPPVVWDILSKKISDINKTNNNLNKVLSGIQATRNSIANQAPTRDRSELFSNKNFHDGVQILITVLPIIFFILILLSVGQSVGIVTMPDEAATIVETTQTGQSWRMFAPDPPTTDGWFVTQGTLMNGGQRDVRTGDEVTFDRPPDLAATYPTARWRKYLENVRSVPNENHRSYAAHYFCSEWNRTHGNNVNKLTIYFMAQQSQLIEEPEPITRRQLHQYDCSGELIQ